MIAAKNEADMLPDAIASVQAISDDIVVIDDVSTDETPEIAKRSGARVIKRKLDGFASQKNFGIKKARHPWVLVLDADERVSQELADSIKHLLPRHNTAAYEIAFRNHVGDQWLKHGGLYPDYHPRLINKERAKYGQREIHEQLEVHGDTERISGDIIHFTYKNYAEYINKVKKYSSLEAKVQSQKPSLLSVMKEFPYRYIRLRGWKDGVPGLVSAALLTYYRWRLYGGQAK